MEKVQNNETKIKTKNHFAEGRFNFSECVSLCVHLRCFAFCVCLGVRIIFFSFINVRPCDWVGLQTLECSTQDQAQGEFSNGMVSMIINRKTESSPSY